MTEGYRNRGEKGTLREKKKKTLLQTPALVCLEIERSIFNTSLILCL